MNDPAFSLYPKMNQSIRAHNVDDQNEQSTSKQIDLRAKHLARSRLRQQASWPTTLEHEQTYDLTEHRPPWRRLLGGADNAPQWRSPLQFLVAPTILTGRNSVHSQDRGPTEFISRAGITSG